MALHGKAHPPVAASAALVALLAASLLTGPPAGATLLVPLSLTDLVHKADRIVVAEVLRARSFWEGKRIYTHSEVEVRELLAGKGIAPGQPLTVRQLGGKVGGKELVVAGTPKLRQGERYLLFLREDAEGRPYHYVLGLSQGAFRLSSPGKKQQVAAPGEPPSPSRPETGAQRGPPPDDEARLLAQVRALIAAGGAGERRGR